MIEANVPTKANKEIKKERVVCEILILWKITIKTKKAKSHDL